MIPGLVIIALSAAGLFLAIRYTKNKKTLVASIVSAALLMIYASMNILSPGWIDHLPFQAGAEAGLTVSRYANTDWEGNVFQRDNIQRIELKRPNPALDGDMFSLHISGLLYCPQSGSYEFFLSSDDGSFLTINQQTIVQNPGLHAFSEESGEVWLEKGFHRIEIRYFNGTSDAGLRLEWIPPAGNRQTIGKGYLFLSRPSRSTLLKFTLLNSILDYGLALAAALTLAAISLTGLRRMINAGIRRYGSAAGKFALEIQSSSDFLCGLPWIALLSGLAVAFLWILLFQPSPGPVHSGFKGTFFDSGDFKNIKSTFDGRNACFNSKTHRKFRQSCFGATFEGYVNLVQPGVVQFALEVDNGARLTVDSRRVIDAWNADPRQTSRGSIHLEAGFHHIFLEMYNRYLPAFIHVSWQPPGQRHLSPIPVRQLTMTVPTQEQFDRMQSRFLIRRLALIALGGIFFLLVFRMRNHFMHTGALPLQSTFILVMTTAVIACFLLMVSGKFDPDHQFGFRWFIGMTLPVRITVLACIIALALPQTWRFLGSLILAVSLTPGISHILGFTAVSMIAAGQVFLTEIRTPLPLLSAGLFISGSLLIIVNRRYLSNSQTQETPATPRNDKYLRFAAYSIIILAAFFLRFHRLSQMPPGLWWDEAQTGIVAREILTGRHPPIYDLRLNAGTIASYPLAVWFSIFGDEILSMRMYTAAIGVVTVGVSYFLYRSFFNPWFSLFGMAVTASSRWLFSINRNTMATIDETILLAFLVLALYVRAARSGRLIQYLPAGILLGLGLHLHTGARVLPLIIGCDIIIQSILHFRSYLQKNLTGIAVMILAASAAFSPMAVFIAKHPDEYFKRSKETLLSTEYPGWYPPPALAENALNYLKMYSFSGDWHPRHNVGNTPQLASWISVIFIIGLAVHLGRPTRSGLLLLMGFLLTSLQGIVTVHSNTANLNRVAENIPIVFVWSVSGAVYLAACIQNLAGSRLSRWINPLLLTGLVLVSSAQEFKRYFIDHLQSPSIMGVFGFQPELTEPAEYASRLLRLHPDLHVWAEYTRADSFRYVQPDHPRLHDLTTDHLPAGFGIDRVVFIILTEDADLTRNVRDRYVIESEEEVPYSLNPNHILFRVFHIMGLKDPTDSSEASGTRSEAEIPQ